MKCDVVHNMRYSLIQEIQKHIRINMAIAHITINNTLLGKGRSQLEGFSGEASWDRFLGKVFSAGRQPRRVNS